MNKEFIQEIFLRIKNKDKYIFIYKSLVKNPETKKIFKTYIRDEIILNDKNRHIFTKVEKIIKHNYILFIFNDERGNDLIIKNAIKKIIMKRGYNDI